LQRRNRSAAQVTAIDAEIAASYPTMQDNAPFMAIPLPFVFSGYEKKAGNAWIREASSLPNNRQVFRTIVG